MKKLIGKFIIVMMIISIVLALLSFISPVGIILGALGTWYYAKKNVDIKKRNISIAMLAVSMPFFIMLLASFGATETKQSSVQALEVNTASTEPSNPEIAEKKPVEEELDTEPEADEPVEVEETKNEYEVEYNLIHDPSVYSGKKVCETTGTGKFDLKDENFLDYAMETLYKELDKSYEKYPESEMIRVMIHDETKSSYMDSPAIAGTFELIDGNWKLSEKTTSYIPLIDPRQNQ